MKKLLTLSVAGLVAVAANAQQARQGAGSNELLPAGKNVVSTFSNVPTTPIGAKGATATVITTDTFSATSLTTGGWTATGNTGSDSWKLATAGTNYIGTLASTTGKTGFMFYDANGIAGLHANVPVQIGYLTSPAYSFTGHNYVGVRFQQLYRRLGDTCYLDVSSNNFSSYTRYSVAPNNTLAGNAQTDNPAVTTINITPAAANQASVKVRFVYIGAFAGTGQFNGSGGTYGWQVDDFQLLDLDQVDLATGRSATVTPLHNANGYTSFGTIPRQFVDSLFAMTNVYNYGGTNQSTVNITSSIYFNATTQSNTRQLSSLAINTNDSLIDFRSEFGIARPATTGTVFTVNTVTQPGDGTPANNVDSVTQVISDSVWAEYRVGTPITGGYYVQRGGNSSTTPPTTPVGFYTGTLYEVGQGKTDTLTSVDLAFHPITVAGGQIRVVIYKLDNSDPANIVWTQYGNTVIRTVATADIPASGSIIWTKFLSNVGAGTTKTYTVLSEGDYGVVVQGINLPAANTTVIYNGKGPAPLVGKFGLSDTLGNSFGTRVTENESVPLMRLNFSNGAKGILNPTVTPPGPGAVGNTIGQAYELNAFPNPANNEVVVSFKLPTAQEATVRLMNTMGQTIMTRSLGTLNAGQKGSATFGTSGLAAGVYYYSVEAAGARATGRVVVAH